MQKTVECEPVLKIKMTPLDNNILMEHGKGRNAAGVFAKICYAIEYLTKSIY